MQSKLLYLLLILPFTLFHQSYGDHILVSALTISYGEWSPLLHICKELLSRNKHLITFVIAENHHNWLDIIDKYNFNKSSYQIIYTPSETTLTGKQIHDANKNEKGMLLLNKAISNSFIAANKLIHIFSNTQQHSKSNGSLINDLEFNLNSNLTIKYNDISSLKLDTKIDVCLFGQLHVFAYHICNAFNIPIIIRAETSFLSRLEYQQFTNSWLYFLDPWTFQTYPNMINGTIMNYSQRLNNIFIKIKDLLFAKYYLHFIVKPMLNQLNNKLDNIITHYKSINYNSLYDLWNKVAIISSLGPPYSNMFYSRPRIKQFGFLLYPSQKLNNQSLELMNWLNENNKPILYIAMGSYHTLSNHILQIIYEKLITHSKQNNYRILWALRQNIYNNITNQQFETNDFKIRNWIDQLRILKHNNIKLFMTHCGGNSVVEGLFGKTAMVLYPQTDDQFFNGKRIEEIEAGIRIKDTQKLSDLTDIINVLLFNSETRKYYENKINVLYEMLMENGGISEAADFVEYAGKYGIEHLFCTLGHRYDCNNNMVPWYQTSMLDVWIIGQIICVMVVFIAYKICNAVVVYLYSEKKYKTE